MDVNQALTVIQTHEFAARVGVASSTSMFIRIVQQQPEYEAIQKAEVSVIKSLYQYLLGLDFDKAYEHPYDTALATLAIAYSDMCNWVLNGWYSNKVGQALEAKDA